VFPKGILDKDPVIAGLDFSSPDTIRKVKPQVSGMPEMLEQSGLTLEGNHHSGIDDARNIARCVILTLKQGYKYT
jgi:inhibitor of KinA sporulation pathway (predicted exonuclease)